MKTDLALGLMLLLAGEFNNSEQVWQQGLDGEALAARTHFAWQRLSENEMTLAIAQGQSAGAGEWVFEFRLADNGELVSALRGHHCAYVWLADSEGYLGTMTETSVCADALPTFWRIDQEWLVASDDSEQIKARRVTYYKGWIALSRQHLDETADADDYIFLSDVRSHDEGFITPILDDGEETGYAVELSRLTYQNTRTSVLKLGIIEEATGETFAYSWANPHAQRIGINLRWVQCGFTLDEDYSLRSGATSVPSDTR